MVLSVLSTVLEQIAHSARVLWLLSSAGFYVTCNAADLPLPDMQGGRRAAVVPYRKCLAALLVRQWAALSIIPPAIDGPGASILESITRNRLDIKSPCFLSGGISPEPGCR